MNIITQFISFLFVLCLTVTSMASANSVVPNDIKKQQDTTVQITDILFYYTQDALDFFNRDLEKLHDYIALQESLGSQGWESIKM